MDLERWTSLFGWMAAIHLVVLIAAALALFVLRDWASRVHARLYGLDPAQVRLVFYVWLGGYKLLWLVFAMIPYLALRLIA